MEALTAPAIAVSPAGAAVLPVVGAESAVARGAVVGPAAVPAEEAEVAVAEEESANRMVSTGSCRPCRDTIWR